MVKMHIVHSQSHNGSVCSCGYVYIAKSIQANSIMDFDALDMVWHVHWNERTVERWPENQMDNN